MSSEQVKPLIDVREDDQFLGDKRDVEAALIHARKFGQGEDYKDRTEAGLGGDALRALKDRVSEAEDGRKKIKAPFKATGDDIDGHYRELLSTPKAAIKALDAKGVRFVQRERGEREAAEQAKQDRLNRDAEEKAAAAAEAARKAEAEPDNSEAQQAAAETHSAAAAAAVATPTPTVQPKQLRGDVSAFGTSTSLDWEVTDLERLPKEHLTFDKRSIAAAVKKEKAVAKAEGRDVNLQCIPGVRIWFKETGVSRGPRQ